jgi:ubiquinone biosynthesis protein COQ9
MASARLSSYQDPHALAPTRDALLQAMLPLVVFDGWSAATLASAARDAGIDSDAVVAAFPGGAVDALELFLKHGDAATEDAIEQLPLAQMKIREKVAAGVMARLHWAQPYKEAVRSGLTTLALPQHAPTGLTALYNTVDTIWFAIGDRSTDMNFYSKRALLAGVYSSTLLIWLDDASEDLEVTRRFLDRRIADVMQIEKGKHWLKNQWSKLGLSSSFRPKRAS